MLGYGGHNLILNLGTTFIVFVAGFFATLVFFLAFKAMKKKNIKGKIFKFVERFHEAIVFSMLIRFMIEGYMELTLMSLINFHNRLFTFDGDKIASWFTVIFTFTLALVPLVLFVFIYKLGEKHKKEEFN